MRVTMNFGMRDQRLHSLGLALLLSGAVAGSAVADTHISMPPPPASTTLNLTTSASTASSTPATATSSATTPAGSVDPGVLALRRYVGARSTPYDTYRSTPGGWRDSGEVWSIWGPYGYPRSGFYRYGWPWVWTIHCSDGG